MKFYFLSLFAVLFLLWGCAPVKFSTETPSNGGGTCSGDACVSTSGPTSWVVQVWGSCSKPCGAGTQSRAVTCLNTNGQTIADQYCTGAKPPTIQDCNTQACSGSLNNWNLGAWGACSVSCGGGTQTRTVECMSNTGIVSDSLCSQPKPGMSQACNTQACPANLVDKVKTVQAGTMANKVDILLVLDDSSSMAADNQKLAERMAGFVTELKNANLDWQMCVTTTDVSYYEGSPIYWSGINTHILNAQSGDLATIFQQTVVDIGSGYSNDEQGIKASILNILSNTRHNCYRTGASHSVIVISDEDERSVGGVYNLSGAQYKDLEYQNQPSSYVAQVRSSFGVDKKYAVNAIVVKDNTCESQQDQQGSPSFIGQRYMELVSLTDGYAGSICDSDYSQNLKYFKEAILQSVTEVELDCTPYGTPTVVFSPAGSYVHQVVGNKVKFSPALPAGTTLTINYKCQI